MTSITINTKQDCINVALLERYHLKYIYLRKKVSLAY